MEKSALFIVDFSIKNQFFFFRRKKIKQKKKNKLQKFYQHMTV